MEIERLPLGQSLADKHRAAELKWRGKPPGIPPEMAIEFMARLMAGSTVRKLTGGGKTLGPAMVSFERFKKHCELHPEWGAEAWRISKINGNLGKGSRLRKMTERFCLKGLHAMVGSNVRIDPSTGRRACLACRNIARDNPPLITPAVLTKIKQALEGGASQNQVCNGYPVGGGKRDASLILTTTHKFYQQRRLDPTFDQFVRFHLEDSLIVGQTTRWRRVRTHIRTTAAREEANEFRSILAMLPIYVLGRDDIAQDVFVAVLDGSLKREDVQTRIRWHIADHNKRFPTKYAKFGDSPLVSLDEVLFDDGTATRGDNVSRGLWD
jgi:hypothetical protein